MYWKNAFADCINLQKIIFPISVKTVKDNAFINCNSISEIIVLNDNIFIASNAFIIQENETILEQKTKYIMHKLDGTPDYRYNPILCTEPINRIRLKKNDKIAIYCNESSNVKGSLKNISEHIYYI